MKKIENHPVEIAVAGEVPGFECGGKPADEVIGHPVHFHIEAQVQKYASVSSTLKAWDLPSNGDSKDIALK